MHLSRIQVQDLRIVDSARLDPSPRLNLITGANGSGKSSLLEAVYLIGTGRSFRTRRNRELIQHGRDKLCVSATSVGEEGEQQTLGIEKTSDSTRIRIGGKNMWNASSLAQNLPVMAILPDSLGVVTGSADLRRSLMDWALFHVKPGYLSLLQSYKQALRQRNSLLRQGGDGIALKSWDERVGESGQLLHGWREKYLGDAQDIVRGFSERLLGVTVDIRYRAGWNTETGLKIALERSQEADRKRGSTTVGPHRADLELSSGGMAVRGRLSRGEAKLLAVAVFLAYAQYVTTCIGRKPVLLIDDLAAELDEENRHRFLDAVIGMGIQVFISASEPRLLDATLSGGTARFHVEQGVVRRVV